MPRDVTTPFTNAAARESGITPSMLRGKAFRRVHRGVHVAASTSLDLVSACRAALLVLPTTAVFSRFTAAQLWGGVVPHRSRLTVTVPHRCSARQPSIDYTRARTMPERRMHRGLPLTSPERTFLDLAASLDLVDLVVLGDSLVRRGRTTPEALRRDAASFRGSRTAVARRAAGLVRRDVDSPMETRLRLLIVLAGLPEPLVNHVLRNEVGGWVYRFDLSYPDLKIAIEYDGRQHADSTEQWTKDVARREDLDTMGWRLVVVLSARLFATPEATLQRVCDVLRARGASARVTSQEWRTHFPQRAA